MKNKFFNGTGQDLTSSFFSTSGGGLAASNRNSDYSVGNFSNLVSSEAPSANNHNVTTNGNFDGREKTDRNNGSDNKQSRPSQEKIWADNNNNNGKGSNNDIAFAILNNDLALSDLFASPEQKPSKNRTEHKNDDVSHEAAKHAEVNVDDYSTTWNVLGTELDSSM
ncbi:asparagine-rich antigen, partial [Reticulomyxa filosa]